ncbi:DUF485 domain-containing protein [Pseudonocardia sp. NPDC049635]|uniref:DUF485 domain-containing protein n=1 Tax=Pseudonocardia sp. NPDC049635 TaxID=3155506 RepID=UPI0033C94054
MSSPAGGPAGTVYQQVQASPEFRAFRTRLRRYVFPMTAIFLAWYLAFVVLASYAPGFMSIRVGDTVTIGLLIGLGQFVSTFVITTLYVRFAEREIDGPAAELRARVETGLAGTTEVRA